MDGSQFDAWTRRGFGAAATGLAGSLLALSAVPGTEARKGKKKKKKKCGKLNDVCNDGKKKCCCGYECPPEGGMTTERSCCRAADFPASSAQECCSGRAELGRCICKTLGQVCSQNQECCSSFCNPATTPDTCGTPPTT